MKKNLIIFLLLSLFTLILFSVGCINDTNHFENNEISFDYPSDWKIGEILDLPRVIVGVYKSSQVDVKISQTKMPSGYTLEKFYKDELNNRTINLAQYCFQSISEKNITVDGVPAHKSIYKIGCNSSQTRQQFQSVIFEKNGFIYSIFCTAIPPEIFDNEKANFNMIINSFHVK